MAARFLRAFAVLGLGLSLFLGAVSSQPAYALGRPRPVPEPGLPASAAVPGYDSQTDSIAFYNYSHWDHSHLPDFMQVAHCSGMALFARQVHNWAVFDPSQPRFATDAEYETLLRLIFNVRTDIIPSAAYGKYVIPGYSSLYEMTSDAGIEEAVKNVLGDALGDAFRFNWNWEPLDVFGSTLASRNGIELRHRATIARGRTSLTYLTDGFKTAHAILLYAYRVEGNQVIYTAYDSNHPGEAYELPYLLDEGKFDHPDWGKRDPWILHPYTDE